LDGANLWRYQFALGPIPYTVFDFLALTARKDGEDLKIEFKRRITEAEILLTDEQQQIFKYMVEIVAEPDADSRTLSRSRA
jgi:hypothetical protein